MSPKKKTEHKGKKLVCRQNPIGAGHGSTRTCSPTDYLSSSKERLKKLFFLSSSKRQWTEEDNRRRLCPPMQVRLFFGSLFLLPLVSVFIKIQSNRIESFFFGSFVLFFCQIASMVSVFQHFVFFVFQFLGALIVIFSLFKYFVDGMDGFGFREIQCDREGRIAV